MAVIAISAEFQLHEARFVAITSTQSVPRVATREIVNSREASFQKWLPQISLGVRFPLDDRPLRGDRLLTLSADRATTLATILT
jgi:hypothetical protein